MSLTAAPPVRKTEPGAVLLIGIVLAALSEAMASTTLSLSRPDIIGDIHATPDEFAWLDLSYIVLKFMGFVMAPWLMTQVNPRRLMLAATLALGAACGLSAITPWLEPLAILRAFQGFAGGVLLVVGQTIIFLAYPRAQQPFLQALFAMGAVVAPATLAPALEGWLIDTGSWTWTFFAIAPVALSAAGLLTISDAARLPADPARALSSFDCILALTWFSSSSFVISQGSRWNWFSEPLIVSLSVVSAASLIALVARQLLYGRSRLVRLDIFQSQDFVFAFAVSFVAGAALFGSGFLIPSFAVSVLRFTPTAAGQLLLPSGASFVGALLLAALLIQQRRIPAVASAPFGIVAMMAAMWMLSGSTLESGAQDMAPALLLRGLGLGFLFLAITLIAFNNLAPINLASGIALFNTGRQLGGLLGVAGLQSLIDYRGAANVSALSAHLTPGTPAVSERLAELAATLAERGLDAGASGKAAIALLAQAVRTQAIVIAYDTAFQAIALLFVVAAPLIVGLKIMQSRISRRAKFSA